MKNLPSGVTIPGSGSSVPLSRVIYVDISTSVVGGNGSIAQPFSTAQAGLAALAAAEAIIQDGNYTLMVCPGNYSGEGTLVWDPVQPSATLSIVNAAGGSWFSQDLTSNQVPMFDAVSNLGTGGITFTGVMVAGPAGVVSVGEIAAQGSQFWNIVDTDFGVNFQNCSFVLGPGGVFTNGGGRISGGRIQAGLINCGGTALIVDTCLFEIDAITFTGSPGQLFLDGMSEYWYDTIAPVLTNGEIVQMGSQIPQETVSVVVPAVLAGQVGYADAIMLGELQGILVGDPVIANPSADLVAAGAGGGYINCYCNSPGVVRCAFLGPLAGGAVDFQFSAP